MIAITMAAAVWTGQALAQSDEVPDETVVGEEVVDEGASEPGEGGEDVLIDPIWSGIDEGDAGEDILDEELIEEGDTPTDDGTYSEGDGEIIDPGLCIECSGVPEGGLVDVPGEFEVEITSDTTDTPLGVDPQAVARGETGGSGNGGPVRVTSDGACLSIIGQRLGAACY
jgi:hypothetical protein